MFMYVLISNLFRISIFHLACGHETHENAEGIVHIFDLAIQVFYLQEAMKQAMGQILAFDFTPRIHSYHKIF